MHTEPGAPDTGGTATLADLTAGGNRYPPYQAARLGADIAAALAERHARGRVHGSLTPTAVVTAPGGRLALLEPDDPSLAGPDRGLWTAYAAPEQLADGTLTPASDVYALGGLLYLMLTGGPPFAEFDLDRLRERKLTEVAPPPSDVEPMLPAALDDLVRRLLDRDPVRRPTAHEAATRLLELAQTPSAPPVATPAPRVFIEEETVEERRGPDPWMYVLGAVILIAIVALVWALVARDDSPAKATVPAVTGLQVAEATNVLRTDHLRVDTVTAPNATVAAGLVVSQTPAAGSRVKRGRTVVLTVSAGAAVAPTPVPIPVPVPDNSATTTTTTPTTTTTTTTTTTPPST